jgi:hypothetical protein
MTNHAPLQDSGSAVVEEAVLNVVPEQEPLPEQVPLAQTCQEPATAGSSPSFITQDLVASVATASESARSFHGPALSTGASEARTAAKQHGVSSLTASKPPGETALQEPAATPMTVAQGDGACSLAEEGFDETSGVQEPPCAEWPQSPALITHEHIGGAADDALEAVEGQGSAVVSKLSVSPKPGVFSPAPGQRSVSSSRGSSRRAAPATSTSTGAPDGSGTVTPFLLQRHRPAPTDGSPAITPFSAMRPHASRSPAGQRRRAGEPLPPPQLGAQPGAVATIGRVAAAQPRRASASAGPVAAKPPPKPRVSASAALAAPHPAAAGPAPRREAVKPLVPAAPPAAAATIRPVVKAAAPKPARPSSASQQAPHGVGRAPALEALSDVAARPEADSRPCRRERDSGAGLQHPLPPRKAPVPVAAVRATSAKPAAAKEPAKQDPSKPDSTTAPGPRRASASGGRPSLAPPAAAQSHQGKGPAAAALSEAGPALVGAVEPVSLASPQAAAAPAASALEVLAAQPSQQPLAAAPSPRDSPHSPDAGLLSLQPRAAPPSRPRDSPVPRLDLSRLGLAAGGPAATPMPFAELVLPVSTSSKVGAKASLRSSPAPPQRSTPARASPAPPKSTPSKATPSKAATGGASAAVLAPAAARAPPKGPEPPRLKVAAVQRGVPAALQPAPALRRQSGSDHGPRPVRQSLGAAPRAALCVGPPAKQGAAPASASVDVATEDQGPIGTGTSAADGPGAQATAPVTTAGALPATETASPLAAPPAPSGAAAAAAGPAGPAADAKPGSRAPRPAPERPPSRQEEERERAQRRKQYAVSLAAQQVGARPPRASLGAPPKVARSSPAHGVQAASPLTAPAAEHAEPAAAAEPATLCAAPATQAAKPPPAPPKPALKPAPVTAAKPCRPSMAETLPAKPVAGHGSAPASSKAVRPGQPAHAKTTAQPASRPAAPTAAAATAEIRTRKAAVPVRPRAGARPINSAGAGSGLHSEAARAARDGAVVAPGAGPTDVATEGVMPQGGAVQVGRCDAPVAKCAWAAA